MQRLLFAILAFSFVVAPSSSQSTQAAKRSLVPTKRIAALEARDTWRHNIVPQRTVQLNYGLAEHYPPTAYVECAAHDGQPILLLEDIDHLLDDIRCATTTSAGGQGGLMQLSFFSDEEFLEAFERWTGLQTFIIVSSHSTCNVDEERAAWRVEEVWGNVSDLTVTFSVQSIPLHFVGRTCRIQYAHTASHYLDVREVPGLRARDVHEYTDSHSIGFDQSNLDSRLTLWPLVNNSFIDQTVVQVLDGLDFHLTCVDCSFKSNFSLAFDLEYTVGNASCLATNSSCFTLNKAGFNITVLEFDQSANLEVAVDNEFTFTTNWTIFPFLDIPQLNFEGITVGPAAGVQLGFELDIPADLNFTYGAQASMPPGTFASFDLLDGSSNWNPNWNADGWDEVNVSQIPFRVNSGQFNISASMWLAPYAEIAFDIESFEATARILAHTPMLTVDANILLNVTRNCTSIGPDDFEYFGKAFSVGAGFEIGPVAHFGIDTRDLSVILNGFNFSTEYDHSFTDFTFSRPLFPTDGLRNPKCFVLSDDSGAAIGGSSSASSSALAHVAAVSPSAVTLAGIPAATGTMFAAASAVPSWDFQKIQSYSSANGHLPTNVNYQQMLQATSVPPDLLNAVKAESGAQSLAYNIWHLFLTAVLSNTLTLLAAL